MVARLKGRAARVPAPDRAPARPGTAGPAASSVAVVAVAAAALAAWTFRGSLAYGFSQDDFLYLARARGLVERLPFGWRWLSQQWWWDVVAGPFAGSALAAHALALGAHAAASALLASLLARRLGAPAALVGAAFFATHPSAYTAVYWAAASGDGLAALLALLALGAALSRRARVVAPPLFALALLAKESVLPLPLAWLAIDATWRRAGDARPPAWRDPAWAACVAIAVVFVLAMRPGGASSPVGGASYALAPSAVAGNLLTYDGWLVNRWFATVRGVSEEVDPKVFAWGAGAILAWLAGAFVPALRRAGWLAAGLTWTAMLAPVLPLANHTYHYYAYAALPAGGALAGALAAALLGGRPRVPAGAAAAALALLLGWDGAALVGRIERTPWTTEGSHADPVTDRALVAGRALADLRAAGLPPGSVVRLWSPQSQAMAAARGAAPEREGYEEANVRLALYDGLAVRVSVPQVDTATFVRAFDPRDSLAWWAVYRYDGGLRVLRARELARALGAGPPGPLTRAGAPASR